MSDVEETLLADAKKLHDESGCKCDPKYIMSCSRMANAILQARRKPDLTGTPAPQHDVRHF